MIVESIFNVFFVFIEFLLNKVPSAYSLPDWLATAIKLMYDVICFVPADVITVLFLNVSFWWGVHMLWAVIEWLYKKIPGVD